MDVGSGNFDGPSPAQLSLSEPPSFKAARRVVLKSVVGMVLLIIGIAGASRLATAEATWHYFLGGVCTALGLGTLAVIIRAGVRYVVGNRRMRLGLCTKCGYEMMQFTYGRCPECGTDPFGC